MEIPTPLELIEDDFEEGEHDKLDEKIRVLFPKLTPEIFDDVSTILFIAIVRQLENRLHTDYFNSSNCEAIISSEPRLRNMLLDGLTNGYKSVRLLSKDLSLSSDCTPDALSVELLRPGEDQSKISWKSY